MCHISWYFANPLENKQRIENYALALCKSNIKVFYNNVAPPCDTCQYKYLSRAEIEHAARSAETALIPCFSSRNIKKIAWKTSDTVLPTSINTNYMSTLPLSLNLYMNLIIINTKPLSFRTLRLHQEMVVFNIKHDVWKDLAEARSSWRKICVGTRYGVSPL